MCDLDETMPNLSKINDFVQNIKNQLQTNLEKINDLRGDLSIGIDYDYFEKIISEQIDEIIENEKKNIQDVTLSQSMIHELIEKTKTYDKIKT